MISISEGNSKLGKIMNISLTPCVSCVPNAPCRSKCYAMKAYRLYPNVRKNWQGNLYAAKKNPNRFFKAIDKAIKLKKPSYFRWHVAGDIRNQRYLDGMINIAVNNPDTRFLCFTKNHELNFGNKPKNLQIVFSLWPSWGKNVDKPKAFMQDGTENRVTGVELVCPGKCKFCKVCWHLSEIKKDVVFIKY